MSLFKRITSCLCGTLLLLRVASGATATLEDIDIQTDEPNPIGTTARVVVKPSYYGDPDGSGAGTPTAGDAGMIGRWDFEEDGTSASGPFLNRIMNGGSSLGPSLTVTGTASTVKGGVSRVLSLPGSGYVSGDLAAPDSSGTVGNFTVSFWFKVSGATTGWQTLWTLENYLHSGTYSAPLVLSYRGLTSTAKYLTIRSLHSPTGKTLASLYDNNAISGLSATSGAAFYLNFPVADLDVNKWHHIAITYNKAGTGSTTGGPFVLYLDGNIRTTSSSVATTPPNLLNNASNKIGVGGPHKMIVGADSVYSVCNLNGSIDRLRMYRTTLSATDVSTLVNQDIDNDKRPDLVEINDVTTFSDPFDPDSPGLQDVVLDDQGLPTTIATTGTWENGGITVTVSNATEITVGMGVSGPGVIPGTTVTGVNISTRVVTLSKAIFPEGANKVLNFINLSAGSTAGKTKLGKWDFEATTASGGVKNLVTTTANGDLTLGGAVVPDSIGMPSKSARFDGGAVMGTAQDLSWGSLGSYSSSFWVKFKAGGELAKTQNRFVIWSMKGIGGNPANQLLFTVAKSAYGVEHFELIGIRPGGTSVVAGGLKWIPDQSLSFVEGGWHHITLVANGSSSYSLFVDGIKYGDGLGNLISTGDAVWKSWAFASSNMRLEAGGTTTTLIGYQNFEGNLDRLRFWGAALNQADATNMYLQDYDGDTIPDITEVNSGLNPLLPINPADLPSAGTDPVFDEKFFLAGHVANPDVLQNLEVNWNFESFRYGATGRYFENQAAVDKQKQKLRPDSGVMLSNSEALTSNYASFNGSGTATAPIGPILQNKDTFAVSGWLKLARGSVWDLPGTPTPLFDLRDTMNGSDTSDSYHVYAIRQGAFTQIFCCNFDRTSTTFPVGNQAMRWVLPRNVRLDNEGWHHLVFQRGIKSGIRTYELYLNSEKLPTSPITGGYSAISTANFTNAIVPTDTLQNGTLFVIGGSKIFGRDYRLKGGWDRLRIYSASLPTATIKALYDQDADDDGVPDREEIGLVGRSPIDPSDAGPVVPPGTDLTKVDIEGLPKSLMDDAALVGLWDFESLPDRGTGFPELSTRGSAMIPNGAPRDVGIDLGAGVPSRSAFLRNGSFISSKADQLAGKQEFSTSLWIKTPPGALTPTNSLPMGVTLLALEDLQAGTGNTLCLRVQTTGASQTMIVQPFDTRNQIPKVVPGGVGWSLLNRRVDDGKWHHFTWVRYASGSAVYLDGQVLDREVGTGTELVANLTVPPRGAPAIVLGRSSARCPEMAMDGNIDRVRIYGRAIKPAEVLALYNQDFDQDGFPDIYEMETFGFDPLHSATYYGIGDSGYDTNWNDDQGITSPSNIISNTIGSWNFESMVGRRAGDSVTSFRFASATSEGDGISTNAVAGAGDAIADGGAQWDVESGMLSRSLFMARESYLSLPVEMLGTSAPALSSSFWIRMAKDEISSRSKELEISNEKVALLTLGVSKAALPSMVFSVDYANKLVVETGFTQKLTGGYDKNQLGRWNATARLDDGRWHQVVMRLNGTSSQIWIDGIQCNIAPGASLGNYTGYGPISSNEPYLWMGFRKNQLLDPNNIIASQLPFRGFNGSLDRIKLFNSSFAISATEIKNLYFQDTDGDQIPDVTEVNSFMDPYTNNGPLIGSVDYDLDGLTKAQEDILGTDWRKPDTDGDWMDDGWESKYTTAPDTFKPLVNDELVRDLPNDADGDGLSGYMEFLLGTDPNNANTDGDGFTDGEEYLAGTNPTDHTDFPASTVPTGIMTTPLTLAGGTPDITSNEAAAPSSSYTGQDATGPRYRKIALNGKPLADEAPESEEETDHHKEETYVDAFSLELHHDTSLIYVPVPASDLVLQVNLSSREESWNNRSSIRPDEKLTTPFGPCWTSNIAAYIDESTEIGVNTNTSPYPEPKLNYSVVDEDGRSLRFGSYNGSTIFAYPGSVSDRKSYQHELRRKSDTQMVLRKKFGTTLTYDAVPNLDQQHNINRTGPSAKYIRHRYYRLSKVEDRYGNQIRYSYPNPDKTLIPSRIFDPKRPELKIDITLKSGDPYRVESIKDPRGYVHTFTYADASLPPLGAIPPVTSRQWLTRITDPLNGKVDYSYEAGYETDPSGGASVYHSYINLVGISDKKGVQTTISYAVEKNKYSLQQSFSGLQPSLIYGLPRIVKTVRRAVGRPEEQVAEFARGAGLNWIYDANGARITSGGLQFVATNEWSNTVTNAIGKKTTYTFRDIKSIPANTQSHGAAFSLSWLIYYLEMDIIHPDSIGTEVYMFDLGSGLSLRQTIDICSHPTFYTYNDTWGGLSLVPSILNQYAVFSKWGDPSAKVDALGRTESYSYSPHYRAMSSKIDVNGTRHETLVDALGRRTSMTSYGADGSKLAEEKFLYGDSRFPAFLTKKITRAFENKSGRPWETDFIQLFEADANGRLSKEIKDMNRNGANDPGDLATSYTYDKNGNKTAVTDAKLNQTRFVFDPLNRLGVTLFPPADGVARGVASKVIKLYDLNGKVHATIDERNATTIFVRDSLNRMVSEIRDMDGAGGPGYSAQSNAESETYYGLTTDGYATGNTAGTVRDQVVTGDIVTAFSYNNVDSVTFKIDPRGVTTATVYDGIERPVAVWENLVSGDTEDTFKYSGEKVLTTYEYDSNSNTGGSVFAGDGFKPTKISRKAVIASYWDVIVSNRYDEVYRPDREEIQYAYDKSVVNFTEYHDTLNQVVKVQASGQDHQMVTFTQYDGLGREVETIRDYGASQTNASTRKYYASTGQLYRVLTPCRSVDGIQTDTETVTDYDAAGRPVVVWQPRTDIAFGSPNFGKVEFSAGTSQSPHTTTGYDANGNANKLTNPLGYEWDFIFDARNRKITEYQALVGGSRPIIQTYYDGQGNVIRTQNARGFWSYNEYDAAGRLTSNKGNPSTGTVLPADDIITSTTYNKGGQIVKVVDGRGAITRNAYDALGRLVITLTDPADGNPSDPNVPGYTPASSRSFDQTEIVVTNTYDDVGNLTSVTDGGDGGYGTSFFQYDGLGRRTSAQWNLAIKQFRERPPLSDSPMYERYVYDGAVLLTRTRSSTYGGTQVTNYTYDGLRRLVGTSYPSMPADDRVHSLDLAGNLLLVTYRNEIPANQTLRGVANEYDSLGRLISEVSAGSLHSYTYDKAGNRLTTTYQEGRYLVSTYDPLSRLSTVTENDSSSASAARQTAYEYDAAGNITGKLLPNNTKTITTYDALSRKRSIEDRNMATSVVLSRFNYEEGGVIGYDKAGNVLNVLEEYTASSTVKNRRVTNTYDWCNRLVTEKMDESGAGGSVVETTYGYDKKNNRVRKSKKTNGILPPAEDIYYTYIYQTSQLYSWYSAAGGDTHTYTYDAFGNRATHVFQGRTDTYGCDLENRLISLDYQTAVDTAKRGLFRYTYDHRSRRVVRDESALAGGELAEVSFSGGQSVQERVSGSMTRQYVRGSDYGGGVGGVLYAFDGAGARLFDHFNSRGDVIGQTDGTAAVKWQAAYEAFGTRVRETAGANPHRQKANTKDEDPSGLLNEGMRYRDLEAGVFITRDPAELIDGPNMFTYVRQNPWTSFDPLGLSEEQAQNVRTFAKVVHFITSGAGLADTGYGRAMTAAASRLPVVGQMHKIRHDIDQTLGVTAKNLEGGSDSYVASAAKARLTTIVENDIPVVSNGKKAVTGETLDTNGDKASLGWFDRAQAGSTAAQEAVLIAYGATKGGGGKAAESPGGATARDVAATGPMEAYNRRKHYGSTPTQADRNAVGAGEGQVADHNPPIVKRYYEGDPATGEKPGFQMTDAERRASAQDRTRMTPQPRSESDQQGGKMSQYSKEKKKEHGL